MRSALTSILVLIAVRPSPCSLQQLLPRRHSPACEPICFEEAIAQRLDGEDEKAPSDGFELVVVVVRLGNAQRSLNSSRARRQAPSLAPSPGQPGGYRSRSPAGTTAAPAPCRPNTVGRHVVVLPCLSLRQRGTGYLYSRAPFSPAPRQIHHCFRFLSTSLWSCFRF